MSALPDDSLVYDLGEVGNRARARVRAGSPGGPPAVPHQIHAPAAEPAVDPFVIFRRAGRNLSLVLPGAGQIVRGEIAPGLLLLTGTGFVAALGWAVLETMSRLSGTLETLGLSRAGGVWTLAALYVTAAVLHLAGVFTASGRDVPAPHPIVAAAASLLIPGWGQFLNGHRIRAVVFLGALWLAGASWIAGSAWAAALLESQGLFLPGGAGWFFSPFVRFTLPAVVWSLAVYDAAVANR